MAENQEIMEEKRIKLRKSDLMKSFAIWELTSEMCLSYERLMSLGFCHAMLPILKRLYPDKDDLADAMTRHMAFFNTENQFGALIPGMIASVEEERANGTDYSDEVINGLKIGLMGPLAGIGDSVDQGIVATIPLAIFVPMALEGSVLAAFIPALIYLVWSYGWSWFLFNKGYSLGKNSVMTILQSGAIKKVIDIASIVGLFMIGCLSAAYVKFETSLEFVSNTEKVSVQEILDGMLPNLLPFCLVMAMYFYISKKVRSI